jgi:hypothetical protein
MASQKKPNWLAATVIIAAWIAVAFFVGNFVLRTFGD